MCSQELVHHAGGSNDYQRLATRLALERLACVWTAVADKVAGPDDFLHDISATPATIACLAAQMPLVRAYTLVISRECSFTPPLWGWFRCWS